MINRREEILLHLMELLRTVSGLQIADGSPCVFRNRGELPPRDKTPGVILLDGPVSRKTSLDGMNFNAMPPAVFTASPEVLLALTPRDDVGNTLLDGQPAPIGPEIAVFEARILDAVLNDDDLVAMLGDDGSVAYDGFESGMRNGSDIGASGAAVIFKFAISYVLDPSELTT